MALVSQPVLVHFQLADILLSPGRYKLCFLVDDDSFVSFSSSSLYVLVSLISFLYFVLWMLAEIVL